MSSGITSYGASHWVAGMFGVISMPTTYYIALALAQPGVDSDGDILAAMEPPPGVGYTRHSYGTGGSNWASNAGALVNLNDITYAAPTGDWGLLTYYVLCDSATSGQVYAFGQLDDPYFITKGLGVLVPAGGIVIALASLDVSIAV